MGILQILQDYILQIITFLASTGNVFFYYRVTRKMKVAEVKKAELTNEVTLSHEWKDIAENREEKLKIKEAKIEVLYTEIGMWRDKYNILLISKNKLEMKCINMTVKLCNKRACKDREPQTGF